MPLPAGRIRLYRRDSDGQMEFTGENTIDHTPAEDTIKLATGSAFDVKGSRRQTDFHVNVNGHILDESFEIKLTNQKQQPVTVNVVEHLYRGDNWEIMRQILRLHQDRQPHRRVPAAGSRQRRRHAHLLRPLHLVTVTQSGVLRSQFCRGSGGCPTAGGATLGRPRSLTARPSTKMGAPGLAFETWESTSLNPQRLRGLRSDDPPISTCPLRAPHRCSRSRLRLGRPIAPPLPPHSTPI